MDLNHIELTQEQKALLAARAEQLGVDAQTLLDDWLGALFEGNGAGNGADAPSVLERMKRVGAVGCVTGPGDLSTNPKHMEGFGTNAGRRSSSAD